MSDSPVHIPDFKLRDLDKCAKVIHLSRPEYIHCAIENRNTKVKNQQAAKRLKKASLRVRKESMCVNKEFNRIEYNPKN